MNRNEDKVKGIEAIRNPILSDETVEKINAYNTCALCSTGLTFSYYSIGFKPIVITEESFCKNCRIYTAKQEFILH